MYFCLLTKQYYISKHLDIIDEIAYEESTKVRSKKAKLYHSPERLYTTCHL